MILNAGISKKDKNKIKNKPTYYEPMDLEYDRDKDPKYINE
jgi:hypothetical protein